MGMGHAGFLGKWGGERERRRIAGNKDLKSSSSLPLHAQGRRRTVLKRHCFGLYFFFFEENENKFRSDPKIGDDSCPPLYNAYEAKKNSSMLCIISL